MNCVDYQFLGNDVSQHIIVDMDAPSSNGYSFHSVMLFFIISGYLITRILLEAGKNTNYFSHFYINRIFRIWPFELVLRTQEHLKQKYSVNRLREQVLSILKQAKEMEVHRI